MLDELVGEESSAAARRQRLERVAPECRCGPACFTTRARSAGRGDFERRHAGSAGPCSAITLSFVAPGARVVASEVRTDQGVASDRFTLRDAKARR